MTYDSSLDTLKHKLLVSYFLNMAVISLVRRSQFHDESKLSEPEKPMFDEWIPKLKQTEFGTDEYQAALAGMGEALQHHYKNNSHHPEHYENGIDGMSLFDVVEMVCDWAAAAGSKGQEINLDYLRQRFEIDDQLLSIIQNTITELI